MIPMTEAQKSAYMSDSAHKQIRLIFPQYKGGLTITNENIDAETMDINRSIMDGDELEVVGCISTAFSITIHDVERSDDLVGQLMFCDINANNTGWVRFFNGNVSSVEKGANRTIHTIKAYDALHDAMNVDMTDFYNNHLACTLNELIREVLPPWGYADFNLPNGNMIHPMGTINKVESISKTDLLKSICQIAGCFGYITGDNKFNIYVVSQNDDHNTARVPVYKSLDYETYETVSITDVVIKESESDEGMSLNQKAIVEMLWDNAPQAQTFSTLDEYKAYYASNLTPYSALISDSDKSSSLATKDRYVFDVTEADGAYTVTPVGVTWDWTIEKAIQQVIKATGIIIDHETKTTRDVISHTKRALLSKGWMTRVGGVVVMPSEDWIINRIFVDDCISILCEIGLYSESKNDALPVSVMTSPSYPSSPDLYLEWYYENPHFSSYNTAYEGFFFFYIQKNIYTEGINAWAVRVGDNFYVVLDKSISNTSYIHRCAYYHNKNNGQWSDFGGNTANSITPFKGSDGVTYYASNAFTGYTGTGTGLYDDSNIPILDKLEDFSSESASPTIIRIDGNEVVANEIIKDENVSKFPKKSSDSSYSVYGNDWQSYLYHSFPSKMVGMNKLNNYDTVTTAGANTAEFFKYFRSWVQDKFINEYFRDRFLAVFDRFVSEKGNDVPQGLMYGIFSSSIETLRLMVVPSEYLAQGITVSPSSLSSNDMVRSGQVFDYYFISIDSYSTGSYSMSRMTAEYSSYWGGYINPNNGSISRALHVDNYDTEVQKVDISLLKLGKGDTQTEVWNGSIEDVQHNVYTVLGNIFWYDQPDRMTMLYNLYNEIAYLADFSYRPFEASFPAMPWLECGDQIILTDKIDGEMLFRAFTMHIHGIGSIFCDASADGNQYQNTFTTSLGISLLDDTRAIAEEALEKANAASEQVVIIERDYATRAWTAEELAKAIEAINQFNIKILDSLPTTGEAGTLYFIKKTDPEQGDIYEEYMWLNNAWEKVGSTKIDLSDYVKKSDLFMSLVNGIPSITFEEV